MILNLIIFLSSLILLFIGTQVLVNSSIILSNKLNINRIIIGFTIVSLATSLPELFVTLSSSIKGYYDFAIGNIIGSNISNISLVLGFTALTGPILFSKKEIYLNYLPLLLISSIFFIVFIYFGVLSLLFGSISILTLILFNTYLFKNGKNSQDLDDYKQSDNFMFLGKKIVINNISLMVIILIFGSLILWIGSELLINSSKNIAKSIGVSDRVISITLVALGTSLPELFASIYAAVKKESQLAVGNLLGSNIFNILAVLGTTSCFQTIILNDNLLPDLIIMLSLTFFLLPCFYFRKIFFTKKNNKIMVISKIEGLTLLILYFLYILFVIN